MLRSGEVNNYPKIIKTLNSPQPPKAGSTLNSISYRGMILKILRSKNWSMDTIVRPLAISSLASDLGYIPMQKRDLSI